MMSDIKQKAREMFDEKFIGYINDDDEIENVKDFIDQIIELAIAEHKKKPAEKIKQDWKNRFNDRFAYNISWGVENSAGEYGLNSQGWDELALFIQSEIDFVIAEREKKIVEIIKTSCESLLDNTKK